MSLKGLIRDIQDLKEGIGNISRRGYETLNRSRSHVAAEECVDVQNKTEAETEVEPQEEEGKENSSSSVWEDLPLDILREIIKKVDVSNTSWPARSNLIACAGVNNQWREIAREVIEPPEACGKFTLVSSLKEPGPKEGIAQCFIKRDRTTASYQLFLGLSPTLAENGKFLLAARRIRRATSTEYVISLDPEDLSRSSGSCIGKLRSNFLGTKFSVYDTQPPHTGALAATSPAGRHAASKPAGGYNVANISYELNVLGTRGPRRMQCSLLTVPASPTEDVPTHLSAKPSGATSGVGGEAGRNYVTGEPLVLKNKSPRWHEQLQCWCLNFRGRVTVASVKNFQLVAAEQPASQDQGGQPQDGDGDGGAGGGAGGVGAAAAAAGVGGGGAAVDQEKVLLQFGKIGKDMFTMDFRYPLSAFQAFAICLSSFDTKLACE